MTNFISEHAAQLLGTRRRPSNLTVSGLSQISTATKGLIPLHVESLSGYRVAMQQPFHILEKISVDLPRVEITPEVLHRTKPYVLADSTFHKPGPIDLLIGSALFPQVLTNERHSLGFNMPFALGTVFGYVIIG
ncbi:hypothetical protein, partial [Klebsiella pneumoniae]|uniref:hypothetical protein n=1 Tax=Klebsiella pneumoniae TaxID=573 RepID=UPI00163D4991